MTSGFAKLLFSIQQKAEDGCLSHGLGDKAGKTLEMFNQHMNQGEVTWRIVKVKRSINK